MAKYTFVVSDETVNSYGFVVLTEGIDTTHFEKNPVMYYMHDRTKGIVGRWENIRKDGKKMFADAVFDDSTELSKQVRDQVLKGFLRSASIGIDNVQQDTINGVETVVKCRLVEISIVDMPSNENAVKLYRQKGGFVYDLARLDEDESFDLRTALINLLGLSDGCSDSEIFAAVQNAIENNLCISVKDAINLGYIGTDQKGVFERMAKAAPAAFNDYIKTQQQKELTKINELISNAENSNVILCYERGIYQEIGKKIGLRAFKQLLDTLKTPISLFDTINKAKGTKDNWTIDDYRKYAPEELKNNSELYKALLARAKGTTPERSLDWYRKNDPEALKNDPELYKTLTNKK